MKYAGAKLENGLLVLKFKNKINHYVFIIFAYIVLISLQLYMIDSLFELVRDIISVVISFGFLSFYIMYNVVLDRHLIFNLDEKMVEVRHILLSASLFEQNITKRKIVMWKFEGDFNTRYSLAYLVNGIPQRLFTLSDNEDVTKLRKELNKFGLDIKIHID
jgi:hypothetical protein